MTAVLTIKLLERKVLQLTLSSLSTEEQIVRNWHSGTPEIAKIPSKTFLWLT